MTDFVTGYGSGSNRMLPGSLGGNTTIVLAMNNVPQEEKGERDPWIWVKILIGMFTVYVIYRLILLLFNLSHATF
jgi:hypothetical protein